jgi:hypothetical protein
LAEEPVPITGEAESVLQLRAHGQDLVNSEGEVNRIGGVASGATDGKLLPFKDPCDTVIATSVDLAIVE